MKAPNKMRTEIAGHTVEGDVEWTTGAASDNKVKYSMSLTNGRLVCGPHDAEGNHLEGDDA